MGTGRSDYERADAYLRELAQKTGARGYRADSVYNISQSFALIAEELRRQYSLGYYPKTGAQAGQRRQIRRSATISIVSRLSGDATGTATTTRAGPLLRKA